MLFERYGKFGSLSCGTIAPLRATVMACHLISEVKISGEVRLLYKSHIVKCFYVSTPLCYGGAGCG